MSHADNLFSASKAVLYSPQVQCFDPLTVAEADASLIKDRIFAFFDRPCGAPVVPFWLRSRQSISYFLGRLGRSSSALSRDLVCLCRKVNSTT